MKFVVMTFKNPRGDSRKSVLKGPEETRLLAHLLTCSFTHGVHWKVDSYMLGHQAILNHTEEVQVRGESALWFRTELLVLSQLAFFAI